MNTLWAAAESTNQRMQGPNAECCAAGGADKVQSGVLGSGSESCLSDLPIYEAPCFDSRSKVGVIVAYDVFAFKVRQTVIRVRPPRGRECDCLGTRQVANTRTQCDRLARLLGCPVVMPDFYRGGVSPMSDPSLGDFMSWVTTGNRKWESVERDLDTTLAHLKAKGCETFALVGFCWGGYVALQAAATGKFACTVGVHAALTLTGDSSGACTEQVARLKAPIMLLQAGNDPDLKPTAQAMKALEGLGDKCVARTFWDCDHGWAAARG